jgi:hypothetical protein
MGQWGVSGVDFLPPQVAKLACQHIACTPWAEKKKKKKKKKKSVDNGPRTQCHVLENLNAG